MSRRRIALNILVDITDGGKYANLALKDALDGVEHEQAKWISALIYKTLDNLYMIDYVIDNYAKGKLHPKIRGVLRIGMCELLYMSTPTSAACNEAVKLTKEIGKGALSGYVNAVMRNAARNPVEELSMPDDPVKALCVKYSWPEHILTMLVEQYGEQEAKAIVSYRDGSTMTIRAQTPYTSEKLEEYLREHGIGFERGSIVSDAFKLKKGFDIANNELFMRGLITAQSESSMLVCKICNAQKGAHILDACAAPGGKTAYLSMLIENTGSISAWELHEHRASLTRKTLDRLNIKNAEVFVRDASKVDEALKKTMDTVLVDAPCSGLGVTGKPDVKYNKSPESLEYITENQLAILKACSEYVRPGGTLVYSTCTVNKNENECIVERFLADNDEFSADDFSDMLPETLKKRADGGMLTLLAHVDGTEGFFMARMRRRESAMTR